MNRNILGWCTSLLLLWSFAAGCSSSAPMDPSDGEGDADDGPPDPAELMDEERPFAVLQVGGWRSLGKIDELAPAFRGAFEVRPAGNLIDDPFRGEQLFFGGLFVAPDQLGGGRRSNALYGLQITEPVPLRVVYASQSYENPEYDVFVTDDDYLEPSPRATGAGLAVTEDAIFVLGGECFGETCAPIDFWRYEIGSKKWAPLAPPSGAVDPRFALASIPDSGELWAFARFDGAGPRFVPFDLESRTWANGRVSVLEGETIVHVVADPIRKDFVLLTTAEGGGVRVHAFDPRAGTTSAVESAPATVPAGAVVYEPGLDVLFFYSSLDGNVTIWDRETDTWRRIVSRDEPYAHTDWRLSYDSAYGAVISLDAQGELREFVWEP